MRSQALFIDDEPLTVELVGIILEKSGFEFRSALSGEEGIEICRREHPDVVVLDLMMPEMDGWEVCRKVREFSDVPILILSALDSHESVSRALQLGADGYLSKPFAANDLVTRLRSYL